MSGFLKYFAYGSNMHPLRLSARVPSCRAMGAAHLTGFRLRFHKRSIDGSAKCNALYTGHASDTIMGVVYQIAAHEKSGLDRFEFRGRGYHEATVHVTSGDERDSVFIYLADPEYIDDFLKPYRWYKQFVVIGARHHGLPAEYVRAIEGVETVEDSDQERAERNFGILRRLKVSGQNK